MGVVRSHSLWFHEVVPQRVIHAASTKVAACIRVLCGVLSSMVSLGHEWVPDLALLTMHVRRCETTMHQLPN